MDNSSESSTSAISRRQILGWGGAGAIGGLAGYLGWPRDQINAAPGKNSSLSQTSASKPEAASSEPELVRDGSLRDDFLPHLNSKFRIEAPSLAGVDCTLVDIGAAQKLVGPAGEFISFSLMFTAPGGFAAESCIYRVNHREMGAMDLFLSPIGRSDERVNLEAVFSKRV